MCTQKKFKSNIKNSNINNVGNINFFLLQSQSFKKHAFFIKLYGILKINIKHNYHKFKQNNIAL